MTNCQFSGSDRVRGAILTAARTSSIFAGEHARGIGHPGLVHGSDGEAVGDGHELDMVKRQRVLPGVWNDGGDPSLAANGLASQTRPISSFVLAQSRSGSAFAVAASC